MLRSMYSGVAGLRNHQAKLDVIGNNIANVNTTSFKSSNISFQEVLGQTIQRATQATSNTLGGTNASQVGLGVTVGNISVNHTEGSVQNTDNPNDLAIEGNGYFVINDGIRTSYTRDGSFSTDSLGNLVTNTGEKVMGWNKGSRTSIDYTRPVSPINVANISMPSQVTTELNFEGNFDVNEEDSFDYSMTIYDSLGESHVLTVEFEKRADTKVFDYEVTAVGATITHGTNTGTITFDDEGKLDTAATNGFSLRFDNGSSIININSNKINFDKDKTTYYDNNSSISGSQDGYESGSFVGSGIDSNGNIVGNFSNGRNESIATIALANFINPAGLEKAGHNSYHSSFNSGEAMVGKPAEGGRGSVKTNSLEMSNVDLAKEFTEMIVAQRGYQANSRVISTSDEMLQELVNIKR